MSAILLAALTMVAGLAAKPKGGEGPVIPESWFSKVDGESVAGQFLDLQGTEGERLLVRYSRIAATGVEIDRVSKDGRVIWRSQIKLKEAEAHSIYIKTVWVRVVGKNKDKIRLEIQGVEWQQEVLDLKSGSLTTN